MPHYEAKVSSKGQITVPVEVRTELRLKEGDTVDFYVDPIDRRVQVIARNAKAAELRGVLSRPGERALSLEEIDDGIGDHLLEKHQGIRQEAGAPSIRPKVRGGKAAG